MSLRASLLAPFVLLATLSAGRTAQAAPSRSSVALWSGNHALTLPRGRWEVGLLSSSHYGLTDRIQLSLHPLVFLAMPHVEAKVRAWGGTGQALAVRARLAYPTWLLGLISREGSGGLLPSTSEPPQALQVEGDVLGTLGWRPGQLASATLGLAVAPHAAFTPAELPLLDFPFLYPRFAALYTVFVPRAGLGFEGALLPRLFSDVQLVAYLLPSLPDVGTAYALEQSASLEYRFSDHVAASLGLRVSEAAYAYGDRTHYLPFADFRCGF